MVAPGSELSADAGGDQYLPLYRQRVTSTLKTALAQGRLTEDEYDERVAQASAARSRGELAALVTDLPLGRMNALARPPTARDVRAGVGAIVTAAAAVAAILLWQPDNGLAFLAFIAAAVTLLVAPILTVGVLVDVRRQKRSGGQLPPWPTTRK